MENHLWGGWSKTVQELFLIPGIVITTLMLLDWSTARMLHCIHGSQLSTKLEFPFWGQA